MSEKRRTLIKKIKEDMEQALSPKRYRHVLGVAKAAIALAKREGLEEDKAELAALLHDSGKELSLTEMQTWASTLFAHLPQEIYENRNLLHGFAGAGIGHVRYHIEDPEILSAIAYHTVGRQGMTKLDKIIFLADYIEETRTFPGVEDIRKQADLGLDEGTLYGFAMTIRYLLETDTPIYKGTVEARNWLIDNRKK